MTRELTGRHVLIIAVTSFVIIVGANLTMLFAATGSFPGLVVKNSYVASQGWNARAAAQAALGWTAGIDFDAGHLTVSVTGSDGSFVPGLDLIATVGHPSSDRADKTLKMNEISGSYHAATPLASGTWRIEIKTASGPAFRKTTTILVPEPR